MLNVSVFRLSVTCSCLPLVSQSRYPGADYNPCVSRWCNVVYLIWNDRQSLSFKAEFEVCSIVWESPPNLKDPHVVSGDRAQDASSGKRLLTFIDCVMKVFWTGGADICQTGWGMFSWIPVLEENLVVKCSSSSRPCDNIWSVVALEAVFSLLLPSCRRQIPLLCQVNTGAGSSAHSFTCNYKYYGYALCNLKNRAAAAAALYVNQPSV